MPPLVWETLLPLLITSNSLLVQCLGLEASVIAREAPSCSKNSYLVVPDNGTGIWPYREYKSFSATPPQFNITSNGEELSPGLIFLDVEDLSAPGKNGESPGEHQQRPVIMTSNGDLVWAGSIGLTSNFHMQTLNGTSVISLWNGTGSAAVQGQASHGSGTVQVFNSKYEQLYNVCPEINLYSPTSTANGCLVDTHESYITSNNTILVPMYNTTQADLSSVGGPTNGWVIDPLAVEVDLFTNKPVFIWSPLKAGIPINTTHNTLQGTGQNSSKPFDWFHTNSIQSYKGNIYVNSRGTWSSYMVEKPSGKILWSINGETGGDFGSLPEGGEFSWQHHARVFDYGKDELLLTCFNDANGVELTKNISTGLGLIVKLPPNKNNPPRLYSSLVDMADPLMAYAEGSYQNLANGNHFLGYGVKAVIKEYGPDPSHGGNVRWSAQFGYLAGNQTAHSYRAFKQVWHATPSTKLDLVVEKAGSNDELSYCAEGSLWRGYISWNGATDIKEYGIYAGYNSSYLHPIAKIQKKGFETEFIIPNEAKFVQVAALYRNSNNTIGRSAVVAVE